jgi:propanol-preferring alcohol dehydrogenase
VGLPAAPICFPALSMAGREVRVQASSVGSRDNLRDVLAMGAAGKLKCRVATRPLEDANEVLGELRRGEVAGRIVLQP